MLYFISNSYLITEEIIDKIDFKEDDEILLFNRKHDLIFPMLLESFEKKYDFMPNIVMCQRETLMSNESEYSYRGSSSPFIGDKNISTFYIIAGGNSMKDGYEFNYDNINIRRQTKKDYNKYKKHLLSLDEKRNIIFVDYKTVLPPYGMGYNIFDIKYYEPYTGFIMLLYIDNKFPNKDKTLVGFTCYSDNTKKRPKDIPTHRGKLEWELLLSYCKSRNIRLLYSKEKDGVLTDGDALVDFEPLFVIDGTIDVENRHLVFPDNIKKSDDYYERTNELFGKR